MSELVPITQHQAGAQPVDFKLPPGLEAEVARLREILGEVNMLAKMMDTWHLDGIIGLAPGGDFVTSIAKVYILVKARAAGVPSNGLWRIAGWGTFDLVVGLVPLGGDVADFFIRSNRKAAEITREHIERRLAQIEAARLRAAGIDVPEEHPAFRALRAG